MNRRQGESPTAKPPFLPGQLVAYRRHPDGEWNDAEFVEGDASYTMVLRHVPGHPGSTLRIVLSNFAYRIQERGEQPCNQTIPTQQKN